jgi:hypothetical protein
LNDSSQHVVRTQERAQGRSRCDRSRHEVPGSSHAGACSMSRRCAPRLQIRAPRLPRVDREIGPSRHEVPGSSHAGACSMSRRCAPPFARSVSVAQRDTNLSRDFGQMSDFCTRSVASNVQPRRQAPLSRRVKWAETAAPLWSWGSSRRASP